MNLIKAVLEPRKAGRPLNKPQPVYDALNWERAGGNTVAGTVQTVYVSEYKRIKIYKQVFRFRNGRCFATFYHDNSTQLISNEIDFIASLEGK